MSIFTDRKFRLTSARIIAAGFLGVILMGALLLCLPASSARGAWTPFMDSLFTALSATCVTGLVVHDTASFWSPFGQLVILILIQIGGLGVITTAFLVQVFAGSRISLIQRTLLQDSIAGDNVAGIIRMSLFILRVTAAAELAGAALLYPVFRRDFGPARGLWYALFHSVSAFCNAGFDLMGIRENYSSLTGYAGNLQVTGTIMMLIIVGGLGFYTWKDMAEHRLHFAAYRLQSKIILCFTALLIFLPACLFAAGEYVGLPAGERVLASLFQSVTTRTAGFNTTDLTQLSDNGRMIMILLMLIGGAPGSTAGGMKITTFAILAATFISICRQSEGAMMFGRRLRRENIQTAVSILMLYLGGFLAAGMAISALERAPLLSCLFETASAIGTVGLTLGLTPQLGQLSRLILMLLMFAGRIGGLTLLYAAVRKTRVRAAHLPSEPVNVG